MFSLNEKDVQKLKKFPTYSQDGKGKDAEIILKVFNPYGRGTWYVLEAEEINNGTDYYCFGYVESPLNPLYDEYGYFTINQLKEVKIPIKIKDMATGEIHELGYGNLEIDRSLDDGIKLKDVLN